MTPWEEDQAMQAKTSHEVWGFDQVASGIHIHKINEQIITTLNALPKVLTVWDSDFYGSMPEVRAT